MKKRIALLLTLTLLFGLASCSLRRDGGDDGAREPVDASSTETHGGSDTPTAPEKPTVPENVDNPGGSDDETGTTEQEPPTGVRPEPEPPALSDEEFLRQKLFDVLVPQWGISASANEYGISFAHNFGTEGSQLILAYPEDLNGLISAMFTDLDGNGAPELLTVRVHQEDNGLKAVAEIHTRESGDAFRTVTLLSCKCPDWLNNLFKIELARVDGRQYLYIWQNYYGDGGEYIIASCKYQFTILTLRDGKPETVHTATVSRNRFGPGPEMLDGEKFQGDPEIHEQADPFVEKIRQTLAPYGISTDLENWDFPLLFTGTSTTVMEYKTEMDHDAAYVLMLTARGCTDLLTPQRIYG